MKNVMHTVSNGFLFRNAEKVYCHIYDRGCGEWCGQYHKNGKAREVHLLCTKPMTVVKISEAA